MSGFRDGSAFPKQIVVSFVFDFSCLMTFIHFSPGQKMVNSNYQTIHRSWNKSDKSRVLVVRDEIENFLADYNSTPYGVGVVVVHVVPVQIKKWITF